MLISQVQDGSTRLEPFALALAVSHVHGPWERALNMGLEHEILAWGLSMILKREPCSWDFRFSLSLSLELRPWARALSLSFELQPCTWAWTLRFDILHWTFRLRSSLALEPWAWVLRLSIEHGDLSLTVEDGPCSWDFSSKTQFCFQIFFLW